jgi:translocation and assembly module TamA
MLKLAGGTLLFLALFAAIAAVADEPVEVVVEGLEGEVLKNVQMALTLPADLVKEGKADLLWLTRFEGQIPEKVRRAMEPFGYYQSRIEVSLETLQDGVYRLDVRVEPGPPVHVTSVKVEIHGPGSEEQKLKDLLSTFPIREGDILRHDRYEQAKQALKAKALELGYLDADFAAHEIRVSLAERKAAINLVFETGPQYRFGEAAFTGDLTYPKSFLRRYLAFKPGEVFSSLKIARTQLNFINSDRFAEVTVIARKEEAEDLRVPVRVNLIPSKPSQRYLKFL